MFRKEAYTIKLNWAPNIFGLILAIVPWLLSDVKIIVRVYIVVGVLIAILVYNLVSLLLQYNKLDKQYNTLENQLRESETKRNALENQLQESETNRDALAEHYERNTDKIQRMEFSLQTLEQCLLHAMINLNQKESNAFNKIYQVFLQSKKYGE